MTDTEYGLSSKAREYWSAVAYDHYSKRSFWEWMGVSCRLVIIFGSYSIAAILLMLTLGDAGVELLSHQPTLAGAATHFTMSVIEGGAIFLMSCVGISFGKMVIALVAEEYPEVVP